VIWLTPDHVARRDIWVGSPISAADNEEGRRMFFLGNLIRRAGRGIGRIARRAAPVLRTVARIAAPIVPR
jgi:hypothetical protein